mmetsp:Transcript_41661/g.77646  ORF Transcript_41661/g.77646 Transcript_41661/m.77646 type:complete len:515 (-) Transcript_41661:121-1665(-)
MSRQVRQSEERKPGSRGSLRESSVLKGVGHSLLGGGKMATELPGEKEASGGLDSGIEEILKQINIRSDESNIQIVHARRDDLNHYSILGNVPLALKQRVVRDATSDIALNRAMGSMCGMAIGDALGHPYEFLPTVDTPGPARFELATLTFRGESNAFHLQRGQWTDDASMGLCMADSLILRERFDGSDMRIRFWCWWNRGYNNAFRKEDHRTGSVGLGGNIAKSLMALTSCRRGEVPPTYDAPTEDAGNGSLMRFTPVAVYLHASDPTEVYKYSRLSSYTTHPGIIAAEACSLLGHLIVAALNLPAGPVNPKEFIEEQTASYLEKSGLSRKSGWGYDQMKWLATGRPELATERCWAWREKSLDIAGTLRARGRSYNGYPVSAGYFGSYSLDGLAMALWAVYHTTSFDEAVTKSVNLLGDADSHGSICGQLAGALYGYTSINRQFLDWQNKWDDHEIAVRALLLHHLGSNRTAEEMLPEVMGPPKLCRTKTETRPQPPKLGREISAPVHHNETRD